MAHFDRVIPPGGEGKVRLRVSLKGFQGEIKKSAAIYSSDEQNPRLAVSVQGVVKTLIEVRPNTAVTFRGMADQVSEHVFELVSQGQPFHITKVETNLDGKIDYTLENIEDGKFYKVKVANKLRQGNYNGFIKCLTDLPQKPEVVVRVSGLIEGEVTVKPQTILIGKLAAQQPERTGKVAVASNRAKPFHITKLIYDERLITVSQAPMTDNEHGYTLEIAARLGSVPTGTRQQTSLVIETDAAPQEKQEIQVHVFNTVDGTARVQTPKPQVPPQRPAGQ